MKNTSNNENKSLFFKFSASAFGVVLAIALILLLVFKFPMVSDFFSNILTVLQPIIVGLFIAYILSPMCSWYSRGVEKFLTKHSKKKKDFSKLAKYSGVTLSLISFVLILFFLVYLIIPSFVKSISVFLNDLPAQWNKVTAWYEDITNDGGWLKGAYDSLPENLKVSVFDKISIQTFIDFVQGNLGNILTGIYSGVVNVVTFVVNFVVGIIVAAYALSNKDKFKFQTKKILFASFSKGKFDFIVDVIKKGNEIFINFINGKLISAAIVGVVCFIGVTLLKLPYPMLITVIIAVTDLIPIFGPYIGAIPCAVLILLSSPIKCIYFVIFIIILQLVEGNIIAPKILGDSTGLSAFWVIFAILVGGGLFGFGGILLGVPTFAVVYYIFKRIIDLKFEAKKQIKTDFEGEKTNEQEIIA